MDVGVLENNPDSGGQGKNTGEGSWGGNGLRSPGGDKSKTIWGSRWETGRVGLRTSDAGRKKGDMRPLGTSELEELEDE